MTRVGLELGPSFCRYRGSPAQTGHFPEEACLGGDRLQSVSFRRGDDLIGRVEEDLKLLAPYTQCEVPQVYRRPDPPTLLGEAHHEDFPGMVRSGAGQLGHVGVTTDDAVHDYDVRGLHLARGLSEVHNPALNAILKSGLAQQALSSILIGRGQLDVHRTGDPRPEKFDLDGANAAADFEQRAADDALLFQKLGDAPRGPIEAVTAIATGLSVRSLLAKDRAVALR